jgi:glyoxylase-like metal-dependent hydrolase (beta-lactamase superfamily II)
LSSSATAEGHTPFREVIAQDVHRLSLPYGHGYVNVYVVLGDDGVRLIDCGQNSAGARHEFHTHLDAMGVRIADVKEIFLTHTHPDHIGLVDGIVAETGARVLVHRSEASATALGAGTRFDPDWLRQHGLPADPNTNFRDHHPLPDGGVELTGTETIDFGPLRLELIWTPGHSPGLLCAYERSRRWLFSTDQLMRVPTPLALFSPVGGDPIASYLQGLDLLEQVDADLVLPGHGRSFEDLPAGLADARQTQAGRTAEVAQWLESGPKRAGDWMNRPHKPGDRLPNLFALAQVLARLTHLQQQGRATLDPVTLGWSAS